MVKESIQGTDRQTGRSRLHPAQQKWTCRQAGEPDRLSDEALPYKGPGEANQGVRKCVVFADNEEISDFAPNREELVAQTRRVSEGTALSLADASGLL